MHAETAGGHARRSAHQVMVLHIAGSSTRRRKRTEALMIGYVYLLEAHVCSHVWHMFCESEERTWHQRAEVFLLLRACYESYLHASYFVVSGEL